MAKTITIDVAPDASVKIEAQGFTGKECEAATDSLERALGMRGGRKRKREFYQTETEPRKVGQ
jgi:hypothetical protein